MYKYFDVGWIWFIFDVYLQFLQFCLGKLWVRGILRSAPYKPFWFPRILVSSQIVLGWNRKPHSIIYSCLQCSMSDFAPFLPMRHAQLRILSKSFQDSAIKNKYNWTGIQIFVETGMQLNSTFRISWGVAFSFTTEFNFNSMKKLLECLYLPTINGRFSMFIGVLYWSNNVMSYLSSLTEWRVKTVIQGWLD